jgi:hypothetical protein
MLNAPATATTGNGVNGDNESRRQRSIYTAFEKAKATHVCTFRSFREWDFTSFNQVIKAIASTLAVCKAEGRTRMAGHSLRYSSLLLTAIGSGLNKI